MIDRSYLLKYLQSGDRILLYGKGKNVQLNYQYLKRQRQFSVAGIVAPLTGQAVDPAVPMYEPYQLNTIPASSYDKIVITVRDQALGVEMYQAIREVVADEKKIVAAHIYLGPATKISLADFTGSRRKLQAEIEKFIDEKYENLHYFDPLIKELKAQTTERNILRRQFKEVTQFLTPLENVVFLYILYLSDAFDAELMECLVQSTLRIDQPELCYFLHGIYFDEISMCFLHEEYLFPKYFVLRRSYAEKVCKMYDLHIQTDKIKKSSDGRIHKICLLHGTLRNHKHSPTLVSIQLSKTLVELGYEVMVMPLDSESNIAWEIPIFSPVHSLTYYGSREFEEYHKEAYHPSVTIEYTDSIEPREKMQHELDKIIEFSPDLIIDMSTDASIFSSIYSQYFLTLCLPLSGYQSSTHFTYYVAKDKGAFLRENSIYGAVNERYVIEYPSLCLLPPDASHHYTRDDFLLNDEDFVLVTVGNRLSTEMTKSFIDNVCESLVVKPNVKWLVVGSKNKYLSETYADYFDAHKILYIKYEDDLPALYEICDLYLNPQRMGGGASIYWAMCCGLPIAILSTTSDIIPIVGMENTAGDSYEKMMEYALELWRNPVVYQAEKNKFQRRAQHFAKEQAEALQAILYTIEQPGKNKGGPK